MGSEMCIRDRVHEIAGQTQFGELSPPIAQQRKSARESGHQKKAVGLALPFRGDQIAWPEAPRFDGQRENGVALRAGDVVPAFKLAGQNVQH